MKKFTIFIILFYLIISKNYNISDLDNSPEIYESTNENLTLSSDINDGPIFISEEIPDNIYEKMLGNSIPFESIEKVDRNSLSYLQLSHFGFDGQIHVGEMIVNKKLANEILEIFKEIYSIKYPIEKIKLIDEYMADDEKSMSDNNTSCFCYRTIARNFFYI